MKKKMYVAPKLTAIVFSSLGGVICSSPTSYDTTLEIWREDTIE